MKRTAAAEYTSDLTCRDCLKHSDHPNGKVGCWRFGNGGCKYQIHDVWHKCCQFVNEQTLKGNPNGY